MHVTNIVGNWILIYGNLGAPALGATGAGIATSIATWVGSLTYFVLAAKHARGTGYFTKRPDRETLRGLLRLSVPNGLQQLFFAGGMVAFHVITGHVGTRELAASNVIITLLLVGILPGMGFGLAAMSFVGHALGRGSPEEARRWGYDVARLAFLTVLVVSLPGLVAPELLLSVFIHDGETRALAAPALRMVSLFMPLDAAGMVFMHCLLGAGDSRRVFITATVFQWLVFLPAAALVGPILMWGLTAIYATNVLYRMIQTIVFGARWRGPTWTKIEV
jgi:putative MATE family efflux protein